MKYIDASIGRVVDKLKDKGVWDKTFLVLSSDNGGPDGDANNWPLRGAKKTNLQGGIRTPAFVSGGFLPEAMRGTKLEELVALWDWYATFAAIAGVQDITDERAAKSQLPPVDSVNQWPLLSGQTAEAPRVELPLASCKGADAGTDPTCGTSDKTTVNGMISWIGDGEDRHLWKLLSGSQQKGGWHSQKSPGKSEAGQNGMPTLDCGDEGCLFDLTLDPSERNNLAGQSSYSEQHDQLKALIKPYKQTVFLPNRGSSSDDKACTKAMGKYNGWWGPWINNNMDLDALPSLAYLNATQSSIVYV